MSRSWSNSVSNRLSTSNRTFETKMKWSVIILSLIGLVVTTSASAHHQTSNPVLTRNYLVLYTGRLTTESYKLRNAVEILKSPNFDNSKKTVIYVHGYGEKPQSNSVKTVIGAYLKRDDYNIMLMDWEQDASGDYFGNVIPNSKKLGEALAQELVNMFNAGLDIEKLHLVGYSMGAQVAARAARKVKAISRGDYTIKRVTGLDPANPGYIVNPVDHIQRSDADFVDIIHTDAGLYGAPTSSGTVDFWPNGGKTLQPGCPIRSFEAFTENDLCSHWRSWEFWAESVANTNPERRFVATLAASWEAFKRGYAYRRMEDPDVFMGNDVPLNVSGDFYLQTNPRAPYSRGLKGVKYDSTVTRNTVGGGSYEEDQA